MNDEDFEKYYNIIKKYFGTYALYDGGYEAKICYEYSVDERRTKLKEIIEEIYQKGKDDKFKDIGYLDVDEFYPDEKEAKP